MAFNNFTSGESIPLGNDLSYDLRQSYAKIVGEHLEDAAIARKADNYYQYFKALEDLHVVVKHKFKKDKKDNEEKYKELRDKAVKLANKYVSTWLGTSRVPNECAEIEEALREMEMFLYEEIDRANMFGSNKRIEGL